MPRRTNAWRTNASMDKCQYWHLSYKAFVFRGICLLTTDTIQMRFQMMCALCNIIYYLEPKEASKSISQCSKPTCAKYRTHGLYVAPPPSLAARGRAISCALPRSRLLPQGRQPNLTHVLPGVHCPAHSLLLYIRLYRAFPW